MFVGRDIRFLGFLFFVALFCHQNRGVCSYVEELRDGDVTCVGRRVPGTGNEERVGEHETSCQKGVDTRLEDDGQVAVSVGNPVDWLAEGDKRVLLARVGEEALRFLPFQILWQPSMFGVGGAVSRWTIWDLPPLLPYFLLGEDQFFSRPGSRVALVRFLGGMIASVPDSVDAQQGDRLEERGRWLLPSYGYGVYHSQSRSDQIQVITMGTPLVFDAPASSLWDSPQVTRIDEHFGRGVEERHFDGLEIGFGNIVRQPSGIFNCQLLRNLRRARIDAEGEVLDRRTGLVRNGRRLRLIERGLP